MRTRARRLWATQVVVVLLGTLVWPAAAGADEVAPSAVSVSAAVTYTVDPDSARVGVFARVTVRHRGAAGAVSDVSLALPRTAAATLSAERNGVPVVMTPGVVDEDLQVWSFALGRELAPGRTAELSLAYDVVQEAGPRVVSSTRLNAAYVSFPVQGLGDTGAGSVRVLMPSWYASRWVDTADLGVAPVEYTAGLARVFELIGVGAEFVAIIEGRDDEKLDRRSVAVDGSDAVVEVAGWPNDGTWSAVTGAKVADLIVELEDVVGQSWPLTGPLVVRETNAGLVHGFGGSFVRSTDGGGEIEVGPVLVDRVLAHELAHAWFDDRLDPWLAEGLAAEFAHLVTSTGSLTNAVERAAADAVPLDSWVPFAGTTATDRWAYGAAEEVVHVLTADLTVAQRHQVVDVLLWGGSAFDDDVAGAVGLADWQRLLDALAVAGDADRAAEETLVEWVLSAPPHETLEDRAEAMTQLGALREHADDWDIPLAVSIAMTQWTFDTAAGAMEAATALLKERDTVAVRAAALELVPPTDAREAFSTEPLRSAQLLRDQASALDAVEHADGATTASRSWVASVGLWGFDESAAIGVVRSRFVEGDYRGVAAQDDALEQRLMRAERDGARRLAGAGAVVALVALIALLGHAGRTRRRLARG